jgi:nicotinamidase-related amidase
MPAPPRLTALRSSLLVVDVQEKLLGKMPDAAKLVREVSFLIDVAQQLLVPVFATEQYPKGLGPTVAEIARRLPYERPAKLSFSCCGAPGVLGDLCSAGRNGVVLVGMETHVCILHSALDLLADGLNVFVPIDAVQARFQVDHEVALSRLKAAGAVVTTVETTVFEWLGGADHPQFKTISKLIQERMAGDRK